MNNNDGSGTAPGVDSGSFVAAPPEADEAKAPVRSQQLLLLGVFWLAIADTVLHLLVQGKAHYLVASTTKTLLIVVLALGLYQMRRWRRNDTMLRAALERSARRTELLLDSPLDGIFAVDPSGRIVYANKAVEQLTGYPQQDLLGQNPHEVLLHTDHNTVMYPFAESAWSKTLRNGHTRAVDGEAFWRSDGSSMPVEYTTSAIREDGRVVGAITVFRDVTERRQAERAKSEFMAIASHEIRTPLTSLRASLAVMESEAQTLPPDVAAVLGIATRNVARLCGLVDDVLDLERMESGRQPFVRGVCTDAELLDDALETVRALAAERDVELSMLAAHTSLWVDRVRITSVLVNLVENAIKHSSTGSRVIASCEVDCGCAVFRITDTGRGVPASERTAIFEKFYQVDSSDSRLHGGTGLGLAIARRIVEQHGGRIWVESDSDAGATFVFSLPPSLTRPQEQAEELKAHA